MGELHEAEIRWAGNSDTINDIISSIGHSQREISILIDEETSELIISFSHHDLQTLRDIGDEIFVLINEIIEQ